MTKLTWTSGVGGSWQTSSNWNPSQIPGAGDDVSISVAGTYTVTDNQTTTVSSLVTSSGATLDISGSSFTILNGTGTGANAGSIDVHDGATLDLEPSSFTNGGSINASTTGKLVMTGVGLANGGGQLNVGTTSSLELTGSVLTGGTLTNTGTVEIKSGASTTLSGVSVTNGFIAGVLELDGQGFVSNPNPSKGPVSVALTTTQPNDVIVLDVVQNGSAVKSVSDSAGLTWTLRATTGSGSETISEYYAVAPAALPADSISVSFNGPTSYVDLNAFAVSGADPAAPFDGAAPSAAATGEPAITSSNPNDFVFAGYRFQNDQSPSAGGGWTAIESAGGYYLSEYQITSAAQTNLVATASTADQNGGIVDAIAQKPAVPGLLEVDAGATLELSRSRIEGGNLTNDGTLQVAGDNDFADINIANTGGAIQIGAGASMDLDNASITGGTLTNLNSLSIEADSTGNNTNSLNGVTSSNQGLIATNGGNLTINSGALTNTGNIQATDGKTIDLSNLQVDNAQGTIGVDKGSQLDLGNAGVTGGAISNSGNINVSGQASLNSVNVTNGVVASGVLALDGTAFYQGPEIPIANGNGDDSVTLSTTQPNDVVVMLVTVDGAVNANDGDDQWDADHLAWHFVAQSGGPLHQIYEYYAIAPHALSNDVVGVNVDGLGSHVTETVFAISGANTSSPFDTNQSVPATPMQSTGTVSTDNANDIVFAGYRFANTETPAAGAGWTQIGAGGNVLSEYQIVSSQQTALTATASASDQNGGIVDAIVQATPTPAVLSVAQNASLSLNNSTIAGGVINNSGTVHVTGGATSTFDNVTVDNQQAMSFGIDGTAFTKRPSTSQNTATVALTTKNANDVIILDIIQNDSSVASVSDAAGLTWHQRAMSTVSGVGSDTIYEYYAIAPTALSADAISVSFKGATSYVDLNAFGVSGANTASPFDVVGPATATAGAASISTNSADDLIFAGYRFWLNETPTAGSGWSTIDSGAGYYLSEYQLVAAKQAALMATASTTDQNGGIVDAIARGPTGSAGAISIDAGSTADLVGATINGGTIANSGTAEVGSGTSVLNGVGVSGGGALTVDVAANLLLEGATVTGGTLVNAGAVDAVGTASVLSGVATTNTGVLEAATGGVLNVNGGSLENSGTLLATTGGRLALDAISTSQLGTVQVDAGASLQLTDMAIGPGTVNNSGAAAFYGTNALTGVTIDNASSAGNVSGELVLDGTGFTSRPTVPTTTMGVSLTTSKANDIIVLEIIQNGAAIQSVTDDAGLNYKLRATAGSSNASILEYYAVAPHALTADKINIAFAGTATYAAVNAFGIAGADTASPFDTGGPATSAKGGAAISTANANDLVFGASRFAFDDTPGAGAGWSAIASGESYFLSEYQTTSSQQSSLQAGATTLDQNGEIIDAVVQAPVSSSVVTNNAGATLNLTGSTISGGVLNNMGTIAAIGGTNAITGATVTNSGEMEASGGGLTISGPVANSGTLVSNGSRLEIDGSVTGNGTATISGSNSVLEFGGASSQNVAFANGATGVLKLDNASSFSGTVAGLADGDSIDLANFKYANNPVIASVTGNGSAGSFTNVTISDGGLSATIQLLNQYANQFAVDSHAYSLTGEQMSNPNQGTLIQLAAHA
jgi:hypothetical protein